VPAVFTGTQDVVSRTDSEFGYDDLNRLTSEKWLSGTSVVHEIASTYDVASQLTGIGGGTADFKNEFAHDNLHRLTGVTQQGQSGGNAVAEKRIDFGYLADGRTSEISRFADLAGTEFVANTLFGYDGAGRLTALTHASSTTTFADYGWAYDAANRMTAFTNAIYSSEGAIYTHDATGQLTGATRSDPSDDESYVYDDNGNRITANGDTYTTGLNNRIESDGTSTYVFDAEGNITRITNIATGDYRDLTWDHRSRLTQVTQYDSADAEQWRVAYVYDAFNRMVGRTEYVNGSSTPASDDVFVYDGYQMILKLDGAGNVQGRTLWGDSVDQILATEDAAGNVVWPLTDHLNTVRDLVSYDSATVTTTLENHIVYNSFGEIVSETNPSVESDFLFTARYTDATTGLQWNLNRWYIPSIGRWASEDPIGFAAGDPNLARYVGNGPQGAIDPSGLQSPSRHHFLGGLPSQPSPTNGITLPTGVRPGDTFWAEIPGFDGPVPIVYQGGYEPINDYGSGQRQCEIGADNRTPRQRYRGELAYQMRYGTRSERVAAINEYYFDEPWQNAGISPGYRATIDLFRPQGYQPGIGGTSNFELIVQISLAGVATARVACRAPKETLLPDSYWINRKAPTQVTPGTRTVNVDKPSSSGGTYHSTTHYDEYGRQIGQTHRTNHGYSDPSSSQFHPNPHHHRRNPITGEKLKDPNSGSRTWPGLFGNDR